VKSLPNIISVLRIFLVIPTVYFLLQHRYTDALVVFVIAGLSDGLDGYLARRYGWMTRLGSFLDPMGDKLLMTASYFMLGYLGQLPVWLVAMVIGRDLIIVLGAIAYRILVKDISMQPLLISKINTGCQIFLVLLMIYSLSTLPYAHSIPQAFSTMMVYIVALTTTLSGISYVLIWSGRARNELQKEVSE